MKLNERCNNCGLCVTKEHKTTTGGYADPCLGVLPGVAYACCGHGEAHNEAYIWFDNGVRLKFEGNSLVNVEVSRMSKYHRWNEDTVATEARGGPDAVLPRGDSKPPHTRS